MQKYLTEFSTLQEYNEFKNTNDCPYVNVSYLSSTDEVIYFRDEIDTYQAQPLTIQFDVIENGPMPLSFCFVNGEGLQNVKTYLRVKKNNDAWVSFEYNLSNMTLDTGISVEQGDVVQIINKNNAFCIGRPWIEWSTYNPHLTVSGNVMSVVYGDDYLYAPANVLPFPDYNLVGPWGNWHYDNVCFSRLFSDGDQFRFSVTDASKLWLPTRQLADYIFSDMFSGAYDLTDAPDIKAKHLPRSACYNMFLNCTSLTSMPNILAETVEEYTFRCMFKGCTSLVNTTELFVNKIIPYDGDPNDSWNYNSYSFWEMFNGCTSLVTAPVWAPNTMTIVMKEGKVPPAFTFCDMFSGCTALEDASTITINLNASAYERSQLMATMFYGCVSLTKSPIFGLYDSPENTATLLLDGDIFRNCGNVSAIYSIYGGPLEVHEQGQLEDVSSAGTVYLPSGSIYLPGGSAENNMPFRLDGSTWTKAVNPNS